MVQCKYCRKMFSARGIGNHQEACKIKYEKEEVEATPRLRTLKAIFEWVI